MSSGPRVATEIRGPWFFIGSSCTTADQVTRLTTLREGAKTAHDGAMADAMTHMKELETAAKLLAASLRWHCGVCSVDCRICVRDSRGSERARA